MIISEKQIMQLIMIARTYAEELRAAGNEFEKFNATSITSILSQITLQQSDELKVIE